jgi:hypothetical protein
MSSYFSDKYPVKKDIVRADMKVNFIDFITIILFISNLFY